MLNIHEMTLNLELGINEHTETYLKRLFSKLECVDKLTIIGDIMDVADVCAEIRKIAKDRNVIIRVVDIVANSH